MSLPIRNVDASCHGSYVSEHTLHEGNAITMFRSHIGLYFKKINRKTSLLLLGTVRRLFHESNGEIGHINKTIAHFTNAKLTARTKKYRVMLTR